MLDHFKMGPDNKINWTSKDILLALMEHDINKKINDETMLMHCTKVNDIKLAKQLIEFGADMSIGDLDNRTPLWLCTIYNCPEIAKLLIESGASMEEDVGHNSPLYNAVKHDNNEVAKVLLELGANPNLKNRDDQTPLHCAVFRKNYEMVSVLLKNNADINIRNNIKILPGQIMLAPIKNQTPYEMAMDSGDDRLISIFEDFINEGKEFKKNDSIEHLNVRKKDINELLDYIYNENEIIILKENLNRFSLAYDSFLEYQANSKNLTFNNIIRLYTNEDKLYKNEETEFNRLIIKFYDDDINKYRELKTIKNELSDKIYENKRVVEKEENIHQFEREIKNLNYRIDNYIPVHVNSLGGEIKDCIGTIMTYLFTSSIYFVAILLIVFNSSQFVVAIICVLWLAFEAAARESLIEEVDNDSLPLFFSMIVTLIWKLFNLGIVLSFLLGIEDNGARISLQVRTSSFLNFFIVPVVIVSCLEKKVKRKKQEFDNQQRQYVDDKIKLQQLEKQYSEAEKTLNKFIGPLKKDLEEYEDEFEEFINKEIDLEELKAYLLNIFNDKRNKLLSKQEEAVEKWNDFAEFRKNHYIREIEELLEEKNVLNKLIKLTDNNNKINKIKINSKNYVNYGDATDYCEYIYDKIDTVDSSL